MISDGKSLLESIISLTEWLSLHTGPLTNQGLVTRDTVSRPSWYVIILYARHASSDILSKWSPFIRVRNLNHPKLLSHVRSALGTQAGMKTSSLAWQCLLGYGVR